MQLSKPITSEEGKKLGLVDAIVSSEELLSVSRQWATEIANRSKPWIRSLHRTDKIGSLSEAREVLKKARQQAKQTTPNMPQHLACLDVIEEGVVHGGYNGVLKVFLVFLFLVYISLVVFLERKILCCFPRLHVISYKEPSETKIPERYFLKWKKRYGICSEAIKMASG